MSNRTNNKRKTMYENILNQVGLNPEEIEIYESLLQHGTQSASELASSTSVKRTYVYSITTTLIEKGLIIQQNKGKVTAFTAKSPDYLLSLLEKQKLNLEQTQKNLENVLPTLKQQFTLVEEKPTIRILEGVEGLKKAHLEVLGEKKEILAYVLINRRYDKPLESFWPTYYQIRRDNKISVRAICPDNKEGIEYKQQDKDNLRETRLIPQESFPVQIEKNIVGNKVVFFSREEDRLIATIIDNKAIADTERAIFELCWKAAKKL